MDSRDRFFATINYDKTDRPASWLGLPVPAAEKKLFAHFGVSSITGLKQKIEDDIWPIEVPFDCPPANHIACAFPFAKLKHNDKPDERTPTAPGFFEYFNDPEDVEKFGWPDPSKMLRKEESLHLAKTIPSDKIRMGVMWSAHFRDACAAFGMEHALTAMMNPDMFQAVIDRITEFYLQANEIFYEATKGYLDAVLIGNDFSSQTGLIISPSHEAILPDIPPANIEAFFAAIKESVE